MTTFLRRLALASAVVAIQHVTLAFAQGNAALQPGDILENGGGQKVKVLQCRTVSYGRECQTVIWENGRAGSNPACWDELMLVKGDARVREALGMPPRRSGPTNALPAPAGKPQSLPERQRVAASGPIPDGSYSCQLWMGSSYVNLGTVRSVGGALNPNPVAKTGGTVTGATATKDGITINYTTARGYRESMDCKRV